MDPKSSWHQFSPGPIQTIPNFFEDQSLYILRLDQLVSWSSGNKYYKLKYLLQYALDNHVHTIVSKGGMFSNHLVALAEACHHFGIEMIAIVRSFGQDDQNPTMQRLKTLNVRIELVAPAEFDEFNKEKSNDRFPGAFFIGEGGLSPEGIRGSAEIVEEIRPFNFNHVVIAGGSMCTALGIIKALPSETQLHIVPAWKGCNNDYIRKLLLEYNIRPACPWDLWPDYHFGGFGKFNQELIDFMIAFTARTGIPLDPVYTGKLLFAVYDKMKNGFFRKEDSILVIHTGGLQGLAGYAYRFPGEWKGYIGKILVESVPAIL